MKFYSQALFTSLLLVALYGCVGSTQNNANTLTIKTFLDSIERTARPGDVVFRMGDDLISSQIKNINDSDFSYSHTGVVIMHEGKKTVAHIAPEETGADTIQYIPIASFLDTAKNLSGALYRYSLDSTEITALQEQIALYKQKDIRFDRVYELQTDDKLYCSEMIAKALAIATHDRIAIKQSFIPKRMQRLMTAFFKKQGATPKLISEYKIITLDNLYRHPACHLVMNFPLKNTN